MTYNEETRILKAADGKWVTNDGIDFAIEAKLAPSENVANWWEVDELPLEPNETKNNYIADENDAPAQDTGDEIETDENANK